MFQSRPRPQGGFSSALNLLELIYHSVVRSVRKDHSNAFLALGVNMMQVLLFVIAFYLMFTFLGLRNTAIRGDFLIYILSGVFVFMCHIKTLSAVMQSEGPASAIMQHAPMNTIISICSAAIGSLYLQTLSLFCILFAYHVGFKPVEIDQPIYAYCMVLLSWFTGIALGLVFLALKPWFPTFVTVLTTIYQRVNMVASGKMFVANTLPNFMLTMFDWNPLFHCIDQTRGYAFINYFPRYSSWQYALAVGVALVMIGLMGEFYTRRHASTSWSARR